MVLAAPFLEELPQEELPLEARDEQHLSPVDVIINIRKELAEFQKAGGRQALLAELREAGKEDLRRATHCPDYPDIESIVEYLQERGLIRSGSRRTRKTRMVGETAGRPKRRPA